MAPLLGLQALVGLFLFFFGARVLHLYSLYIGSLHSRMGDDELMDEKTLSQSGNVCSCCEDVSGVRLPIPAGEKP